MADQSVNRLVEAVNGFFERESMDIEQALKKGLLVESEFSLLRSYCFRS